MMKKALICMSVVALMCALPAFAQDVQQSGRPLEAHATAAQRVAQPPTLPPGGIFYNSLGPNALDLYNANDGFLVLGANNPQGMGSQSIAISFTAFANEHVTKVKMPMEYYNLGDGAGNTFVVGVWNDNAGVPGNPIDSVNKVTNGNFPACCALVNTSFKAGGVALTANTQYWVVADTVAGSTTEAVWNFTYLTFGYSQGGGAWGVGDSTLPAAEISGTVP
jgi:hypothetical protein